jgi:hypothetical protein
MAIAAITALSTNLPRFPQEAVQPQTSGNQPESISPHKPHSVAHDPAIVQDYTVAVSSLLTMTILRASPYAGPEHLLHLNKLETQTRLMALALSSLSPARSDYATADYQQAFHWDQVIALLATLAKEQRITWKKQSFYVVEFRSKLKENIDNDRLYLLDKHSHVEATASGGLLKYWYGSPDSERYNLATCKNFLIRKYFYTDQPKASGKAKKTQLMVDADHGTRKPEQ